MVGLGHIAQVAVLPAFAHARRNSELVAVVSGDRTKRRDMSKRYRLERTFTYEEFDQCLVRASIHRRRVQPNLVRVLLHAHNFIPLGARNHLDVKSYPLLRFLNHLRCAQT